MLSHDTAMKIQGIKIFFRHLLGRWPGLRKTCRQGRPVIEGLEPRFLLNCDALQVQPGPAASSAAIVEDLVPSRMPDLPGLAPVIEDARSLAGQIVYLDADGQDGFVYHGPVHLGPIDLEGLTLTGKLVGMEDQVLTAVTYVLTEVFAPVGITFVSNKPEAGQAFSTIYISSDDEAFRQLGGYQGLAEGLDIANQDRQDNAVVFVQDLSSATGVDTAAIAIASRVCHELGHLLGYVHRKDIDEIRSGLVDINRYAHRLVNLAHEAGVDDRYITYGPTRQKIESKDTYVHQWIAAQAWVFYDQQFKFAEIGAYLGTISGSNDDKWYPVDQRQFSGDDLLEGVFEEDTLGIWLRHFVQGGEDEALLTGLAKVPKDDGLILQTLLKGTVTEMVTDPTDGRYLSGYEAAQVLWQQAIDAYEGGQKGLSYYYLGRVAHLVADMCTPAHVHLDRHAAVQGDGDYYELVTASQKRFMSWGIDGQRAGPTGQIPVYSDLKGLFSTTIKYTQEYPCWNLAGKLQVPGLDRDDIPNTGRHRPDLVGPQSGWGMEDYWIVADDLMPWAIEQTAALYRLFYSQVDRQVPVVQFISKLGISEDAPSLASARLSIQALAQDTCSGLAVDGLVFLIEKELDGQWIQVSSIRSSDGILRSRLQQDGIYRVKVLATDAAGNTGSTQWGYLTIEDASTCPPLVTVDPLRTTDPSPALSGTVDDPNASVTIEVAGKMYPAINNGDGTWTLPAGLIGPLAPGRYQIVATAKDLRGNIGTNPGADELWIVLMDEGFEDGLDGWITCDQGNKAGPSRWRIEKGQLVQLSNIYGSDTGVARCGTFLGYQAGSEWSDYQVHLTLSSGDDDDIGIMFRVQDDHNYYRFSWNRQIGYRRLVRCQDGSFAVLASDLVGYEMGADYRVQIKAHGPLLQVYVDDQLVLSSVDQTFRNGTIALYCWANAGSHFDNLVVEDLSGQDIPPVITAIQCEPSLITDLQRSTVQVQAVDYDGEQATLSYLWTCTEGDLIGPDSAQALYTPPDVDGSVDIELQIQVSDGIEVTSSIVKLTVIDADAPRLLTEDFQDKDMDGWSIVQEGSWPLRARWSSTDGALVETSGISRRNDGIAARGTYAFFKYGLNWTDLLASVQICSRDTRDLGLMFRYVDKDNYYRFSWNSRAGYARLVRCLGGRFELLTWSAFRYVKDRVYTIAVLASGQDLRVYVDGKPLLAYQDGLIAAGSIALYSSGNKGSSFDQIEVYAV